MDKIVTLGEIMLRLSTTNNRRIIQSKTFQADYGGGEANVAVSLANFGIPCEYVTKIPKNPLGESIVRYLKENGVGTENIVFGGERLGTYYLEVGTSVRSSSVVYDRKYSSFSTFEFSELELDKLFKDCKILHLSGITPALSESCKNLTIEIIKEAKKRGVLVSFDFNYRSKLWTLDEASEVLTTYLPYIDICLAGVLDAKNILKIQLEKEYDNHRELLKAYYDEISKKYPNIKYFLSTSREVHSVDENSLTGFIYSNGELLSSKTYRFSIVDRVGGGDAFAAGGLFGLYHNHNLQDVVEFATAASVYKHTIAGDANLAFTDDIYNLLNNGVSSVKR